MNMSYSRPTPITVFGILNIVFGSLGILCVPFGLFAIIAMADQLNFTPLFRTYTLASQGIGFFAAIWLFACGIGLLNLKRWAREGSIAYGCVAILIGLIGMIVTIVRLAGGAITAEMMPGTIGGLVGGLVGFVYPILLIVFMRKPLFVEWCNQ